VPVGPGLLLPRVARQLDPDPELVPEDAGQDPHLGHQHLMEPAGAEGLPGLPGSCRPMVGTCNRLCARLWDENLLVGGPFGRQEGRHWPAHWSAAHWPAQYPLVSAASKLSSQNFRHLGVPLILLSGVDHLGKTVKREHIHK
jgi:hypothetical protein